MNKIKFVYFDIGGVMTNTDDYFKKATTKFGINLNDFIKFWEGDENRDKLTKGEITCQDFWIKAIEKFNLKNADNFDFLESWIDDYKEQLDVHDLARKVSKKYKIGLLSNLYPGMITRLIEKGKVADIKYSAIVLSCDVGFRKPEKEIYRIATDRAGVNSEEILFIDDKKDFIEGAKKAGWKTLWFDMDNKEKVIRELKRILQI